MLFYFQFYNYLYKTLKNHYVIKNASGKQNAVVKKRKNETFSHKL